MRGWESKVSKGDVQDGRIRGIEGSVKDVWNGGGILGIMGETLEETLMGFDKIRWNPWWTWT